MPAPNDAVTGSLLHSHPAYHEPLTAEGRVDMWLGALSGMRVDN